MSLEPAPKRRGLSYKWVVLINTTVGVVMSSLDGSILTISLPDITRSINASVVEVMWVVMGYSLVTTSLILPIARLADMKGRVRLYNLGFAVFTVASALCGFAQTGGQLVLFRLLQGVGSALLISNSTALIIDAVPEHERGAALGFNMMAGTTAFVTGTVVGGVITEFLSWRYIFFLNLPLGTFATAWAFLRLREMVEPERNARFDLGGMLTFPLAIATLLGGFTMIVLGNWDLPITKLMFVASVGLLLAFYQIERRVPEPMMDLGLFKIRVFWAGNTSLFMSMLSRGANQFVLTWYFQALLLDSPLSAGLKLIPLSVAVAVVSPISGRLGDKFGSRWVSTFGLCGSLVAQLWMSRLSTDTPYSQLFVAMLLLGAGHGFFQTPNTVAVMSAVPANRRGVAAGSRNLLFNTGQTMAIGVAMVILSTTMSYKALVALFAGTDTGTAIPTAAFVDGLHHVYFVAALLTGVAVILSALRGNEPGRRISIVLEEEARLKEVPETEAALA
ncbi:MAG TPA: MFS transporter [Chloroflexota bacterium]|nr:MFS transporter [Chloroflexota bacterium]